MCTGAFQVIARAGNQIQTCSTSRRRRNGPEKALCALAPAPTLCQQGREPPRALFRKGTKLAFGCCIRESETLLGKPSSAPMRVRSGKQVFLVSPPSPLLVIGTRRAWASSCSLCTGALQVIARTGNQLQRCSPFRRRRMGPEKALCALAPAPQLSLVREGPS